jgi:hypothetical protein
MDSVEGASSREGFWSYKPSGMSIWKKNLGMGHEFDSRVNRPFPRTLSVSIYLHFPSNRWILTLCFRGL